MAAHPPRHCSRQKRHAAAAAAVVARLAKRMATRSCQTRFETSDACWDDGDMLRGRAAGVELLDAFEMPRSVLRAARRGNKVTVAF
eukprot:354887-Chlamydomonas_euryale.AAC.11